ncbi:MAG: VOC family protein [Gemmatimonadota bacterium]|nr:VOC family protein [Gemmatimonadota bacterium]
MLAPAVASAQGSCKGRPNEGTPTCDTTQLKAPFAPTGWKTVALDHFTMHAVDYKKEAAYYMALMNWKLRSDDGKQAVLDIGDIGSVVIVGGYQPPPPPPPRVLSAADSAALAARGGGAGGRGAGGAGGGRGGPRQSPQAVWDSFSWAIAPWNAKTVEAELRKRGLNPVADNSEGPGCESFHVKDPDGFDLQISNGCFAKARKSAPKAVAWTQPAPFENTNWKTVWLDHISFGVSDYKGEVAFYQALIGWKPTGDEGSQNEVWMCDDCGNSLIRGPNSLSPTYDKSTPHRASIGHISFGITPFDADGTKAELDKRGLTARPDIGKTGDIHDPTALYKSYHTTTPQGFDLQISNANKANRTVR